MDKAGHFFLLLCLAILAAGLFGMAHNQISYSVGPDYFHQYKFAQFAIPAEIPPRIGAAMVGWKASWWMGILIGLPTFGLGAMILPTGAALKSAGLRAIVMVLLTTSIAALGGLLFAIMTIDAEIAAQLPLPVAANDPLGFVRAGIMHDASYLGGFAGVLLSIWIIFRAAKRAENK